MKEPIGHRVAGLPSYVDKLERELLRPVTPEELPRWLRPILTVRAVVSLSTLAAMATGVMAWNVMVERESAEALRAQLVELGSVQATSAALVNPLPAPKDFTALLPVQPPVSEVIAELHRASSSARVVILELQVRPDSATPQHLGQTELGIHLQGSYPAIKNVLRDVLAKTKYCTVRRLSLQRDTDLAHSGGTRPAGHRVLLADLTLVLWTRSLQAIYESPADIEATNAEHGVRP
jgi:Tfp pilus assembly protein PilO